MIIILITARPSHIIYALPILLSFEYRVRLSSFSFDLSELALLVVAIVWLMRVWQGNRVQALDEERSDMWLILALVVCALPATFLESNTIHAASVYRDLILPFLFLLVFLKARLKKAQVHMLIKLACVLALVNAVLGIIQYATGNFLWFAGPDEAEWQAYKIGFAKLSMFADLLGLRDTLPVGLYTGANNFGCFLSLPLCLATTLAFSAGLAKRKRLICLVASIVMFVCLLFTMFRSGLLVYIASMITVYLILGRSRRPVRAVFAIALIGLAAFSFLSQGLFDWDQFGSIEGRQEMVSDALTLIRAHPELLLTGGYADQYHAQTHAPQEIHNVALYLIVQFGLPATVIFFAFFMRFFRRVALAAASVRGLERNVLVAIAVSIGVNVFLYGSTTMLVDSVQTSIWLLFWVGVGGYLLAHSKAEVRCAFRPGVPQPAISPEQGAHA